MTKRLRISLFAFAALLLMAGAAVLIAHWSVRQVPSFYLAAIEQDEEVQAEANDECLRQAADLASDVQRPGHWQAVFTADQINGWLAVDLIRNYPHALPAELENPRVDIHEGLTTLACGYKESELTAVVSISFDLYLNSPNVVAVRVRGVRAGLMPIPLSSVLEAISNAARNVDLELEWRQLHGDPVALIKLPQSFYEDENEMRLDSIELREGAIFVAGRTTIADKHDLVRADASQPDMVQQELVQADEPTQDLVQAEEPEPADPKVADEDSAAEVEIGSTTSEKVQR